ncbi:MAG: HD domain-containing protein [Acidimicrobiia bacterium]
MLATVTVAVVVALVVRGPMPSFALVVALCVLLLLAIHQQIAVGTDIGQTANVMLVMAAVAAFRDEGSLLGPMIVGCVGGLWWPHIQSHQWRKVIFNSSAEGLGALAAALVFFAFPQSFAASVPGFLVAAIPSTLVYVVLNTFLVSSVVALATSRPVWQPVRELQASEIQAYPFALLGMFAGRLFGNFGIAVAPLLVVPILTARQTFASYLELKSSQEAMVRTLIKALEAKDPYTSGHAERVAVYAQYMGEEMSFGPRRMERLRFAALMHDIGKLVVPNHILNKPGKLTEEEYARVRQHEAVSVEVLRRIDFLRPVAPSASGDFSHYEPDAKKHPIEPYIVHTADAYDAMTSTRSYRKALTQQVAFDELVNNSGTQFHPTTVNALINAIGKRDEHHGAGYEQDVHDWVVAPPDAGVGSAGLGDLAPDDETGDRKFAP